MPVIAKVICAADGSATPHDGRYIVRWNPHTEAGVLDCETTDLLKRAKRWRDAAEVRYERSRVSRVQPIRPWDGMPNCPLCGIAIEVTKCS